MEFPEHIMHSILYFLEERQGSKEIARASLVSKAWLSAWRTRPHLRFSVFDHKEELDFVRYVCLTMNRYRDNKIRILELQLWCWFGQHWIFNDWLKIASELGVKKCILRFDIYSSFWNPVILEASSLEELDIRWLRSFKREPNTPFVKLYVHRYLSCCNLKRLYLGSVRIRDDALHNLVSSCPLIESMELRKCHGLKNLQVTNLEHLRELRVTYLMDLLRIKIWSPTLETLKVVEPFEDASIKDPAELQHIEVKSPKFHMFNYEGWTYIPRLISFEGGSRPRHCVFRFTTSKCVDASWLLKLKAFLGHIIPSNIFLRILCRGTTTLAKEDIEVGLASFQPHFENLLLYGF